jgi:hypothetical protein
LSFPPQHSEKRGNGVSKQCEALEKTIIYRFILSFSFRFKRIDAAILMRMHNLKIHGEPRRLRWVAALGAACLALAGCAGTGQDVAGSLMVTPGKYETYTYTCEQIADLLKTQTTREKQLEELMARAGPVVSAASYDSEYLQVRGEIRELRQTAADKHCEQKAASAPPTAKTKR